jgi:TPR repeat protein
MSLDPQNLILKFLFWMTVLAIYYNSKDKKKKHNPKYEEAIALLKDIAPENEQQVLILFEEVINDPKTDTEIKDKASYYLAHLKWNGETTVIENFESLYDDFLALSQSKYLTDDEKENCKCYLFTMDIRGHVEDRRPLGETKSMIEDFIRGKVITKTYRLYATHLLSFLKFADTEHRDLEAAKKGFEEVISSDLYIDFKREAKFFLAEIRGRQEGITEDNAEELESAYMVNLDNPMLTDYRQGIARLRLIQIKKEIFKDKKPDFIGARVLTQKTLFEDRFSFLKDLLLTYRAEMDLNGEGIESPDYASARKHAFEALLEKEVDDLKPRLFYVIAAAAAFSPEPNFAEAREYFKKVIKYPIEESQEAGGLALYALARMDMEGQGILRPNYKTAEEYCQKLMEHKEKIGDAFLDEIQKMIADLRYIKER